MRSERTDVLGTVEPRAAVASDVPDLESTADRTIIDLRGQGPLVSAGHYRYLAAQPALPDQVHTGLLVLAFAIRSTFDFVVDGSSIVVEPGAVIVIPPGHVYSTGAAAQTRGELLWLVVGTNRALSAMPGEDDRSISETIDNLVAAGVTTRPAPRESVDLLLRVLTATDLRWSGTRTWQHALCMAALMELAHAVWNADAASQPLHPALRQSLEWATAHLEEPITVAQLIEVSGMSSTHFFQQFARAFGTSPKDYILRMKVSRARELLEGADSVTDISHALGFSSSQHFSTAFRRYVGMSPTGYRRVARGTAAS